MELKKSVVQIYVETSSGAPQGQLRGSGFNIDTAGLIVTNRHLLENAVDVRVSFPELGTYRAREWVVSQYVDLAVIMLLEAEDLPVVTISDVPVQLDEEILVIGNPLQFARIANKGVLAGYRNSSGREMPFLVVEALIYPGNSGSPVFNNRGEVVGVIFATLPSSDPAEVRGLAIDAAELKIFLGGQ